MGIIVTIVPYVLITIRAKNVKRAFMFDGAIVIHVWIIMELGVWLVIVATVAVKLLTSIFSNIQVATIAAISVRIRAMVSGKVALNVIILRAA